MSSPFVGVVPDGFEYTPGPDLGMLLAFHVVNAANRSRDSAHASHSNDLFECFASVKVLRVIYQSLENGV
jgi:hypothetical protein